MFSITSISVKNPSSTVSNERGEIVQVFYGDPEVEVVMTAWGSEAVNAVYPLMGKQIDLKAILSSERVRQAVNEEIQNYTRVISLED